MSVQGKQLVNSRRLNSVQRSVNDLFFEKGMFTMGDLTANLANVNFTGGLNSQLHAGKLEVKTKSNLDISASGVTINTLLIDDKINQTVISGINWKKADIKLASFPGHLKRNSPGFSLKEIGGTNTDLLIVDSGKKLSLHLKDLSADKLSITTGSKPVVNGLRASGNNLQMANGSVQLNIEDLQLADHQLSVFKNLTYDQKNEGDSIKVSVPQLEFEPDINNIIEGDINTANIRIIKPDVQIHLRSNGNEGSKKKPFDLPQTAINRLIIEQPTLQLSNNSGKGMAKISWDGRGNEIELHDVRLAHNSLARISAKSIQLSLHHFLYTGDGGKTFDAKEGKLNVQLNNVELQQMETNDWDWKGVISRLDAKNFIVDSLGKNCGKLTITTARLSDFSVISTSLLNIRELMTNNTKFRLGEMTGSYSDARNHFSWYNTNYDKNTRLLSVDSFSYRPVQDQQ